MAEAAIWEFKGGDVLFREGDPWDGLYLIKSGNVEIFRERGGKTIQLGLQGPNEFLGTATIFTREPRTAGARALSDLSVQFFDSEFIHQNFGFSNPAVALLMKDVIGRLKFVNQQLTEARLQQANDTPPWHITLRHIRQLINLLIVLLRSLTFEFEGKTYFQTSNLGTLLQDVLRFRSDYADNLFGLLTRSGVLTAAETEAYGLCLVNPSISKLQAFLEFSEKTERLEILTPNAQETEALPALRLLVQLMDLPGYGDVIPIDRLAPFLEKLWTEVPGIESAMVLANMGFVSILDDGRVRLDCPKILQYTYFNQILIGLHTLTPFLLD
ncbi:Cyclic nucleotide-binding domain-containing protein [Verrucomicrobium sp. GAS474]|uniref:cyclic nucleotide-binding domain-containing protein n=1 Tax=Verrucomicrobium sp. GAS474 TaxID=1882831 RepID=UPI00087AEDA9|nr:cyclic nucleotide-binding domain-containing protein [Verrucomicrobium sp. GAS474]SDT85886.1 Cyclic nucleotide-binding domain-containing protein [Verrucomicrobium sp. GAS474]